MTGSPENDSPAAAADSPMICLAERVSRDVFYLSHHLAALRKEYGLSFAEQAATFGLEPEGLAWLALCSMPATAEDLARIAGPLGMEAEALGELLQLDLLP
jgi:hypothetical protein